MTQELIRYGISNVHWAVKTTDENGKVSYEKPVAFPYATAFTREPAGEDVPIYADNTEIIRLKNDQGFTGTLSTTRIPDNFNDVVLGRKKAKDGTYTHEVGIEGATVALTYQFETEPGLSPIRGVLYNVTFGQPSETSNTATDSVETQTIEIPFTATPVKLLDETVIDGKYRSGVFVGKQTSQETDADVHATWNAGIVLPSYDVTP